MHLEYQQFEFSISFPDSISFSTNPVFLFRSVLGMNLRKLSCINKSVQNRSLCNYNSTCAYSVLFESIVDKKNKAIPGRDKSSHPYVLALKKEVPLKSPVSKIVLVVTLLGKYIPYIPYFFETIKIAGEKGIDKNRYKFEIEDITVDGSSIIDGESLNMAFPVKEWKFVQEEKIENGSILVQLKSPLRYKKQGEFVKTPETYDFFRSLFRRMRTLCFFYGEVSEETLDKKEVLSKISEMQITWKDYEHYSARQKKAMQLGGMKGNFTLSDSFSSKEISLLQAARIFGAGKNTNFGLGQIDYWERLEK